jgi:hypothetical protein
MMSHLTATGFRGFRAMELIMILNRCPRPRRLQQLFPCPCDTSSIRQRLQLGEPETRDFLEMT